MCVDFTWMVSDSEELMEVTHRRLGVQLHGAYLSGIEATKAINRVIGKTWVSAFSNPLTNPRL